MWHNVWRLLALTVALAPLAPASGSTPVAALWTFDEPEGERTAADLGPDGLDGTVGADLRTGVLEDGVLVYRFPEVAPNSPPVRPEHLVTVEDSPQLDPDDGDFTVTVRFRTTSSPSNVVQKGQNGTRGGYWKVEQDGGVVRCLFMDGSGRGVTAHSRLPVADGEWHTVVCARTPSDVTLFVDGARLAREGGRTGVVANTWPLSIGGKNRCDQDAVGCDYFSGDVDVVRIQKE
jgi:hypothetical protein